MTISSRAPLNLLEVLVQRRLFSLNLDLDANDLRDLTRRMVDDANTISGDIVLRAAKRGQFASELIGLVLSRFLLQDELGNPGRCGWYFLDDYAMWLGQREERLADILALSPQRLGEQIVLLALISEAKYVGRDALADARRSSAVQLRETVLRMQEALFGNPSRLDRDLWLARLADMLLDGIEIPATEGNTLHEWRDSIRNGTAPLLLKGYSHVFVHSQESGAGDPASAFRSPTSTTPGRRSTAATMSGNSCSPTIATRAHGRYAPPSAMTPRGMPVLRRLPVRASFGLPSRVLPDKARGSRDDDTPPPAATPVPPIVLSRNPGGTACCLGIPGRHPRRRPMGDFSVALRDPCRHPGVALVREINPLQPKPPPGSRGCPLRGFCLGRGERYSAFFPD